MNCRSLSTLTLRLEKWPFCFSYSIKSSSSSVDHRLSDFNLRVVLTHIMCLQHQWSVFEVNVHTKADLSHWGNNKVSTGNFWVLCLPLFLHSKWYHGCIFVYKADKEISKYFALFQKQVCNSKWRARPSAREHICLRPVLVPLSLLEIQLTQLKTKLLRNSNILIYSLQESPLWK